MVRMWERVYATSRSQAIERLAVMRHGSSYEVLAAFEGGYHGKEWQILIRKLERK